MERQHFQMDMAIDTDAANTAGGAVANGCCHHREHKEAQQTCLHDESGEVHSQMTTRVYFSGEVRIDF